MPDTTDSVTPQGGTDDPVTGDTPLAEAGEKALDAWKARARAAEKEAKRVKQLEEELNQFRERDKTEQQRMEERLVAAERAAAERENQLLRYQVGTAVGLPADLIERLRGDTQDELLEDAKKLLAIIPAAPSRTAGAIDQGTRSDPNVALNSDALLESVKARLGIR